ncbi:MAG: hypothetical protein V2A73_13690, partial [Pseudomonadota bacterium]
MTGSVGTCVSVPTGQDPSEECAGAGVCGGTCNGEGACQFPVTGTACGVCATCDGAGACSRVPDDDDACGTIDCDVLDTACRDYAD